MAPEKNGYNKTVEFYVALYLVKLQHFLTSFKADSKFNHSRNPLFSENLRPITVFTNDQVLL